MNVIRWLLPTASFNETINNLKIKIKKVMCRQIQISGGKILINGAVYENDGDFPEISNGGLASSAVSLESGEYFVLGDNRNNSEDSRYADIGNVKKKYIVGKLWFTISPRSKIGFLKG